MSQFFLDGSLRTYYLGEQIEEGLSYPLMTAEVAAAVIKRQDAVKFHPCQPCHPTHASYASSGRTLHLSAFRVAPSRGGQSLLKAVRGQPGEPRGVTGVTLPSTIAGSTFQVLRTTCQSCR